MVQPASDETRQRLNLTLAFSGSHFSPAASERERARLAALGLTLREGTPSERDLAWIDAEFGGYWSSEARAGYTLVALDGDAPAGFITVDQRRIRWCWSPANGAGLLGPLGVATAHRGRGIGASLARLGLGVLRSRGYSRATFAAVLGDAMRQWYASVASLPLDVKPARYARRRHRATVLASGGGTNFQAVIDAARSGDIDVDPTALVAIVPGHSPSSELRAPASTRASSGGTGPPKRGPRTTHACSPRSTSQPDLVLSWGGCTCCRRSSSRASHTFSTSIRAICPVRRGRGDGRGSRRECDSRISRRASDPRCVGGRRGVVRRNRPSSRE